MTAVEQVSALQKACARLFAMGLPMPTLGSDGFARLPSLPSFNPEQVMCAVQWQWDRFRANPADSLLLYAEADLAVETIPTGDPYWRNAGSDQR
jgi:hypothetical protein